MDTFLVSDVSLGVGSTPEKMVHVTITGHVKTAEQANMPRR